MDRLDAIHSLQFCQKSRIQRRLEGRKIFRGLGVIPENEIRILIIWHYGSFPIAADNGSQAVKDRQAHCQGEKDHQRLFLILL